MRLRMNQKEAARWARARSRGRLRFILVYGVLLFGGIWLVLWAATLLTVSEEYFARAFSQPLSLVGAVALGGAAWGFLVWEFCEFLFRHRLGSSDEDRPPIG